MIWLLLIFSLSLGANAVQLPPVETRATPRPPTEARPPIVTPSSGESMASARDNRAERRWLITANYSYLDILIPSKYGVTVAYVEDAQTTYELDYMRASYGLGWLGLDIGSITEQRLALLWRSFGQRNTFNFHAGIHYNSFDIHLGNKMLSRVAPGADYSVIELETLGLSGGLGNRWQTRRGFIWSFDWFQLHIPLATVKERAPFITGATDDDNRGKAQTTVNLIKRMPRLVAVKIQLGYTF